MIEDVERAFEAHDAFVRADSGFGVETTPFETRVEVDAPLSFRLRIVVPSLSGATAETVADVVEEGWYEIFDLRVGDAFDVAVADGEVTTELAGDVVEVRATYSADGAKQGVEDAKAVVDFVEGSYVSGMIPGYEYEEPAAGLLERARRKEGPSEG